MELGQLRVGLEPQLLREPPTEAAVDVEGVGSATRTREGDHQLRVEPLVERVLSSQRLELRDEVPVEPGVQVRIDTALECVEVDCVGPADLVLERGLVGEVGIRRASPERERPPERPSAIDRRAARRAAGTLLDELLEPREIELPGGDSKDAAATLGREDVDGAGASTVERLAKLGDVAVQHRGSAPGRRLAPQRVDQVVHRDDLVPAGEEHGEQRARLRASEPHRTAVDQHFERAQDAVLEPPGAVHRVEAR